MKPLQMLGLGTEEGRSYFILKKENLFSKHFNEILEKLNISDRVYDKKYDRILDSIEERENRIEHFRNKEFDIDVVYTKDRIILLVRANNAKLEQFKSLILAYAKMEE